MLKVKLEHKVLGDPSVLRVLDYGDQIHLLPFEPRKQMPQTRIVLDTGNLRRLKKLIETMDI